MMIFFRKYFFFIINFIFININNGFFEKTKEMYLKNKKLIKTIFGIGSSFYLLNLFYKSTDFYQMKNLSNKILDDYIKYKKINIKSFKNFNSLIDSIKLNKENPIIINIIDSISIYDENLSKNLYAKFIFLNKDLKNRFEEIEFLNSQKPILSDIPSLFNDNNFDSNSDFNNFINNFVKKVQNIDKERNESYINQTKDLINNYFLAIDNNFIYPYLREKFNKK